jgi:hypothetical protein
MFFFAIFTSRQPQSSIRNQKKSKFQYRIFKRQEGLHVFFFIANRILKIIPFNIFKMMCINYKFQNILQI